MRGGHDWSSFGVPPNGDNDDGWKILLPILEEVVRNYDKMWQETHANGQTLVYYAKYMAEQGQTIIVKFWMTADGILKLSDAYLK